jgi:hypothetical protein
MVQSATKPADVDSRRAMRLGEILVNAGLLTQEQVNQGLETQARRRGGRLGIHLVELGFITERQLAGTLSEQLGLPFVSVDIASNIPSSIIKLIPSSVAAEYQVFPVALKGRILHVCMSDPANLEKVDMLAFRLSCPIQPCVVTEFTLDYALELYYGLRCAPAPVQLTDDSTSDVAFVQVAEASADNSAGLRLSRADFLSSATAHLHSTAAAALPDIATSLADAKTESDIVESIKLFFGFVYSQIVVLTLRGSILSPIAETGLALDPQLFESIHLPMQKDGLLARTIADQNVHDDENTTDPTLVLLCNYVGMATRQVTLVPLVDGCDVRFLVVAGGLDQTEIKRMLPAIDRVRHQVQYSFQILHLREQLLEDDGSVVSK